LRRQDAGFFVVVTLFAATVVALFVWPCCRRGAGAPGFEAVDRGAELS
jgi:hypothetical protein